MGPVHVMGVTQYRIYRFGIKEIQKMHECEFKKDNMYINMYIKL